MKVALLGHSYVRDLETFSFSLPGNSVHTFRYYWKPGSCFDYWNAKPLQLLDCISFQPDIIYIILGSNSIVDSLPLCETKAKALGLYKYLKTALPSTLIVQCEIEDRFLVKPNSRGTPSHSVYHKLRRKLNVYLSKAKDPDFFCNIGGPGRLDDLKYYRRDKIHLNSLGLAKYWSCIENHLSYVISNTTN